MRSQKAFAACCLALMMVSAPGCNDESSTVVVVRLELSGTAPTDAIDTLRANVDYMGKIATHDFPSTAGPLIFPTSFSLQLPRDVTGSINLEVQGLASGAVRARASKAGIVITPGGAIEETLVLSCVGACASVDGGMMPPPVDAGSTPMDAMGACGNGMVDDGEVCDTAITKGEAGACPPTDCGDGISCTADVASGAGCTLRCQHTEILASAAGDGCCPANGTFETDPDCSKTCGNGMVEAGETCDKGIAAGDPGSCPNAATCVDEQSCTQDSLLSANTCAARCLHAAISTMISGDGCCPSQATHETDLDCPVVCGNGLLEMGEVCDTGIHAPAANACPARCDDGKSCTADRLVGTGCQSKCSFTDITAFVDGDGCCPAGGNASGDNDCARICGNAVVEPGESCDNKIAQGKPGSCPSSCESGGCSVSTLKGAAADCSAVCETSQIEKCVKAAKDGCCPPGCKFENDADCSPSCGNGQVDPGETCDTAIAPGNPGACPNACFDGNSCTKDVLQSEGTCNAKCVFVAINNFVDGDACCPKGGDANVDSDCPAECGNGVLERPGEKCDKAIGSGMSGGCPSMCPASKECQAYQLDGSAGMCTAECVLSTVTDCKSDDGCCPSTCNANSDKDCPALCGNGVVERGEKCDKAITAGNPGACAAVCNDGNQCTTDSVSGSVEDCTRTCVSSSITACAKGDSCCPAGCNASNDPDCAPSCGNGIVESEEYCDPPSSCPTACKDDRDPCTRNQLDGDPAKCTARCVYPAITTCSPVSDMCCPSNCASKFDPDCNVIF